MLDSELLRRFYVTAQSKNLSHAAKKLNMVQSAVSTAIATLEAQLKTQLFVRTRGGLVVNAKGLELCEHVRKMEEETALFRKKFYEEDEKMEGELRIVTYPYVGSELLVPVLNEFLKAYPKLNVKIHMDPDNILPDQTGVGIGGIIDRPSADLVQKELFSVHTQLFASKDYLDRMGTPKTVEELNQHRIIAYSSTYYSIHRGVKLLETIGKKPGERPRTPNFEVDSLSGMVNAALNGYGIAELPSYSRILNSNLVKVLPDVKTKDIMLFFIFRRNSENSVKINLLYEFLFKEWR